MRGMRFGLVLVGLIVVGCFSKSPTSPSGFFFEVTLAPGQTTAVDGATISIVFQGVSGDSRCPVNVACVTGGDALVKIEVIPTSGNRLPYELHTGSMQPVRHDDLTIALVELTPYPFSGRSIEPAEYRAKIKITR